MSATTGPSAVAAALYYASRDRSQEHPERHLRGFTGILADVLARIADTPQSRLPELLPWEWKKLDGRAAAA